MPCWLQRHLSIESEIVQLTLTSLATQQIVDQRHQHQLANLVLGNVCEDCNKGWMSGLEQAAAPFLGAVAEGSKALSALNESELEVLGRWSAKTAYGFSEVGLEPHVPSGHLQMLASGNLPSRVVILARQQKPSDTRFALCINREWRGHAALIRAAARQVHRTSYRVGMLLGDLILVVVYWPLAGWGYRVERDFLTLVWPHSADITRYDHPAPAWSPDAVDLCNRATLVTTVSWRPEAIGIAGNRRRRR